MTRSIHPLCESTPSVNSTDTGAKPTAAVNERQFDKLHAEYADVFEGLGRLPGQHHIKLDSAVHPVIHAPRRVPVALRDELKTKLDDMVQQDIITPVTEPTDWVSSVLLVAKPGKLRVCIDPRDLNIAIMREHYPMPMLEEISTRLGRASVFTVLDAKSGFWQVELDEESSRLTTFNTSFGRYRWKRLPYGISSAPEVWQKKMHEVIEGLKGVEVIADDFLIYGNDDKEHDENLRSFMLRCRERHLVLNSEKVRYKLDEVRYMGCLITANGMMPDPRKIDAIVGMPLPADVAGVRRLLGTVQYLGKFVQGLSELTAPLRELIRKDNEFDWSESHTKAVQAIHAKLSTAPVLRYYDVNKEVTIQADASMSGLGAALMQDGQPVYATLSGR